MNTQKGLSKMHFLVIAAFAVVAAAGVATIVWTAITLFVPAGKGQSKYGYGTNNTVNQTLIDTNEEYRQANVSINQNTDHATDTSQYIEEYKRALIDATDPIQEGHIEYAMALAYIREGDYMSAIPILKDIGTSKVYSRYDKASAVQTLGGIRFSFDDPSVDQVIFADPPYSAMLAKGDYIESYIKLFSYGSKFVPLVSIEARLAQLYALDIDRSYQTSHSTTTPDIVAMKKLLDQNTQNVLKSITANDSTTKTNGGIQSALLHIAIADGRLAELGMVSTFVAEDAFAKAGSFDPSLNNGFWNLQYARYLTEVYGASRSSQIIELLSHVYGGGYQPADPIIQFLTRERLNTLGVRPSLIQMSTIDPQFKNFLTSLGWGKKDFAQ